MKFRGDNANILLAGCIYTKKKVLHITIITVGTKYCVPHGRNNCLFKIQGKHKRTHAQHTHNTKNKQLGLVSLSLQSFNILCYDQIYTYVPTNTVQFARTRDKFDS